MSDTMLPNNATEQEEALEQATARVGDVPVPIRDLWNPETCPVALLPWLAWAFSVDRWSDTWTEQQKRQVIANAYYVHQHKGTLGAVKRGMQSLGLDAVVTEWWEESPQGAPYTFSVEILLSQEGVDPSLQQELVRIIESTKNARSHMDGFRFSLTSEGVVYVAAATTGGVSADVYSDTIVDMFAASNELHQIIENELHDAVGSLA